MRRVGVGLLLGAVAGCAGSRPSPRGPVGGGAAAPSRLPGGVGQGSTWVDAEHGFRIVRPDGEWTFASGASLSSETIEVPLIVSNAAQSAQVVVQVAPAVATPAQFAQRLTSGLRSQAGFETSEVAPIPLAEGAVGFDFEAGQDVRGRVAILEGSEGRVFVLLATWPGDAPRGVESAVARILASMRAHDRGSRPPDD